MRRRISWPRQDRCCPYGSFCFFFNDTATTEIYTLSLHDALPISTGRERQGDVVCSATRRASATSRTRSEEHTSELQSPCNLVCRLLLEKKRTRFLSPSRFAQQSVHTLLQFQISRNHYHNVRRTSY